jgi:NAD(P) transhydrogenase subunit alpha
MKLLTPGKDGTLVLDMDDVVQRGITVVLDGVRMWPPPPVQVSAAPAAKAAAAELVAPKPSVFTPAVKLGVTGIGVLALWLLSAFAPEPIPEHFTVLMLSVVIGYYVIGKVHHALHTPLMSITNAISGIIVVGALLQIGSHDTTIRVLSFVAILLASINVFGGFAVTKRMLGMFSKG